MSSSHTFPEFWSWVILQWFPETSLLAGNERSQSINKIRLLGFDKINRPTINQILSFYYFLISIFYSKLSNKLDLNKSTKMQARGQTQAVKLTIIIFCFCYFANYTKKIKSTFRTVHIICKKYPQWCTDVSAANLYKLILD